MSTSNLRRSSSTFNHHTRTKIKDPKPLSSTITATMVTQQYRRPWPETAVVGACLSSLLLAPCAGFLQPLPSSLIRPLNTQKKDIVLNENSNSVMDEQGGMILASDKNLLNMAFSSLDDKDKYETVLTGLCAKVIDGGSSSAKEGLVDPIRLIEEMNSSRIVAGPRSIISLVDVRV